MEPAESIPAEGSPAAGARQLWSPGAEPSGALEEEEVLPAARWEFDKHGLSQSRRWAERGMRSRRHFGAFGALG